MVFFVLPLAGILWRVPWSDIVSVLGQSSSRDALRLSLETTLAATALSVLFGVPLAWLLARTTFRGRGVVRALALLPLVLPPVVGGVALFYAFGRRGLVGQWIERWFHFELPFSIWAVILAETFVAMPFLVITVEGALRGLDTRLRRCGGRVWCGTMDGDATSHAPDDRPVDPGRHGARVGACARRVRCDHHICRQFPGRTQTLCHDLSRVRER